MKRVLLISGSDSSSGAGMQADCAAIRSLGLFPLCAVTCITSQNSKGLRMIQPTDPDIFRDQIDATLEDFLPDAVKVGMIPTPRHMHILIDALNRYNLPNVVLDPILAPSRGKSILPSDEIFTYETLTELAKTIRLITPNIPEARKLLMDNQLNNPEDIMTPEKIGRRLCEIYGFENVLVKGGHSDSSNESTDLLIDRKQDVIRFTYSRIDTHNSHGTGCALSSLISGLLAKGNRMEEAVSGAGTILHESLQRNRLIQFYDDPHCNNGPAFF